MTEGGGDTIPIQLCYRIYVDKNEIQGEKD